MGIFSSFQALKTTISLVEALWRCAPGREKHYGTIVRQSMVIICKTAGGFFEIAKDGGEEAGVTNRVVCNKSLGRCGFVERGRGRPRYTRPTTPATETCRWGPRPGGQRYKTRRPDIAFKKAESSTGQICGIDNQPAASE